MGTWADLLWARNDEICLLESCKSLKLFKYDKNSIFCTFQEKARIMNFNLIFQPPVIDYEKRHYDYRVQSILEGMVQRDPRKRHTINVICNYCWFKNSSYYKELLKEDKKFP